MRRTLLGAWALASLALVLALAFNHWRGMPIRPGRPMGNGTGFVTPWGARELINRGAVAVDVRDEAAFEDGHLPKAERMPPLVPDSALLIVYGRDSRTDDVAGPVADLHRLGFTRLLVMPDGWKGWVDAGFYYKAP